MSQEVEQVVSINLLNDDCLLKIFDFLQFEDKICLRRACKRWRRLLDHQLAKQRALRLGRFTSKGGYQQTSGLELECRQHSHPNHRQLTVSIFNQHLCQLPADTQTRCFSINRYDYLHRCLKFNAQNITMLSLGQLNISYRLMLMLSANLPHLEHIELISCASRARDYQAQFGRLSSQNQNNNSNNQLQQQSQQNHHHLSQGNLINSTRGNYYHNQINTLDTQSRIPSLESFNSQKYAAIFGSSEQPHATEVFNQHPDEQTNSHERLLRQKFLRNCSLITTYKTEPYWPKLQHILIRNCHQLSELSLCLLMAMTSRTLTHLHVESNQRLTGEFLNYCGPKLEQLAIKYCPMMQFRFLDDLMKLKQVLNPASQIYIAKQEPTRPRVHLKSNASLEPDRPGIGKTDEQENMGPQFMAETDFNFAQTIYCHL